MAADAVTDIDQYDRLPHQPSMIASRPKLVWPNKARLAVAFVVCGEYYEMQPAADAFIPANVPGGFGRAPYPDFRAFSQREYGNRVGFFRVMQAFDERTLKATAAIDESVARRYPYLVRQCQERDWEIAAHGFSLTRVISSKMSEEAERAYIRSSIDQLEKITGRKPRGWHSPEYGQSQRTPRLLAECGIEYVLDWPNDEQPFLMLGETNRPLVSIAMALELDDVISGWHRRLSMDRWRNAIRDAIDQLLNDGCSNARHLVINLHPWLIGHPHRIGYLEEVLDDVQKRSGIWLTTAGEISGYVRQTNR